MGRNPKQLDVQSAAIRVGGKCNRVGVSDYHGVIEFQEADSFKIIDQNKTTMVSYLLNVLIQIFYGFNFSFC